MTFLLRWKMVVNRKMNQVIDRDFQEIFERFPHFCLINKYSCLNKDSWQKEEQDTLDKNKNK